MPPSQRQLERHIRACAQDTANVHIKRKHTVTRMNERGVTRTMVYEVLRQRVIDMTPEPDPKFPGVRCRMRRYVSGKDVGVVVYVDHPGPDLVVITVIDID
jgi:hypothetical protein